MSQNNTKIIIIVLLVVLAISAIIVYKNMSSSESAQGTEEDVLNTNETTQSQKPVDTSQGSEAETAMSVFDDLVKTQVPEGSIKYVLNDKSSASYEALKQYVGKPVETIVGTTNNVKGAGWYDAEGKKYYLIGNIDLVGLKSSSEKRDSDILPLFNPTLVVIEIDGDNSQDTISMTEPFETDVTTNLTIGNVTKPVVFKVKGMLDEEKFSAEGSADVLISDFGIKAPSALNIFSVADELKLKFTVAGEAIQEVSTE